MKSLLLVAILAVVCPCAWAGDLTVRFVRNDLVISDKGHRMSLPMEVDAEKDPVAPFAHAIQKKRKGEYFVIVTTSAWSRGYPPRGGYCGAGVEAYLVWLHIVDGKITEQDDYRYESCRRDIFGAQIRWRGPLFVVSAESVSDEKDGDEVLVQTMTYTYDVRNPEKGIQEERSKPHK